MAEQQTFAAALRAVESNRPEGFYNQVRTTPKGRRVIGAYGFPADEWPRIAEEVGLGGARWRDPRAQDIVAERYFDLLYRKYGDWRLVAVAWKAGEEIADRVVENPGLLSEPSLKPVKDYMSQVMRQASDDIKAHTPVMPDGSPVEANRFQPTMRGLEGTGTTPTAGEALTGVLRGMRDRLRANTPATDAPTAEALEPEEFDRRLSEGRSVG